MKQEACCLAETPAAPGRGRRLWLAGLLGLVSAMGPLCTDLYLPALPLLAEQLQAEPSLVQLSLTACLLGLALGQVLLGPYSDAVGRRRPLLASLAVFTAASFLCAAAASVWTLIALRFVQGLAGAGGIVISRAVVRDLYAGPELTRFFALLMLAHSVAPTLAPSLGGLLLAVTDWSGIFTALGLLGGALVLAVAGGLPESLAAERRLPRGGGAAWTAFRRLLRDPSFMRHVRVQGLVGASLFAYIAGSPFVLQNVFGLSAQAFGLCFGANSLGILAATQLAGRLSRRCGEARLLAGGLLLSAWGSAALLLGLWLHLSLALVLPALFLVVSCVGLIMTASFSLAIRDQAQAAGSASALLGLVPFVAGAVASPLVGVAGSHSAWPMGLVMVTANLAALACGRRAAAAPRG